MRPAVLMVAVVALVAPSVPFARAEAAPSPLRWRLWRITRTGSAARPLAFDIAVTPASAESLVFLVGLRRTGAAQRVVMSTLWERGGFYPYVYQGGTTTTTCPSSSGCDYGGGDDVRFGMSSDEPVKDEYLVVTWAGAAQTTLTEPGWRVREVPTPTARRVLARDTAATGVYANLASAEHYSGSAASGGKRGSIAWTTLPCDVGTGDGLLTTQPAVTSATRQLDCSGDSHASSIVSRAVRWTVTADAVGVVTGAPATRLLVIDLPKP